MNRSRIAGLSRRVMLQIIRDRRTFVLVVIIPILLLLLADRLFDSETDRYVIGLVNLDRGIPIPGGKVISLGKEIEYGVDQDEFFSIRVLDKDQVDPALGKSEVKAVLMMPEDATREFVTTGELGLDLRLEGSNPSLSKMIEGKIFEIAVTALVRVASSGIVPSLSIIPAAGTRVHPVAPDDFPVHIATSFFFGGTDFGMMDYAAPMYIAFLVLFFVFLITSVSLIQERTRGTMERLLATPTTRVEIIFGYFIGLGVYALMQGAVILAFSLLVLKIVYAGSLWLLFLIIIVLSVVGVALGMLASSFARNEFQVVQFIPLLIIPQMLLGGIIVPVEELPGILRPLAYFMPLTYANIALRDVMIKGWGLPEIYRQLIVLSGFAVAFILLDIIALKRRIE